jgi:hypothetical protein
VHVQDRAVVLDGRALAPERLEVVDEPLTGALDREPRLDLGGSLLLHHLPQLALGLGAGEALAATRLAHRAELALASGLPPAPVIVAVPDAD